MRETQEALAAPGDITLFEPALRWADILVRADILERRSGSCRLIEVKSSAKVKDYHVTNAGIQTWVLRGAGLTVARTEIAHINNQFVYPGGGDYRGLFTYADVSDAILPLQGLPCDMRSGNFVGHQRFARGPERVSVRGAAAHN